ncbi:MAG: ABC transporter ATP-binding protein [Candidatus Saganbacteria bacterium]|nr:ABC transporter ATP-binding protein [Candidatus Saganbacteria bacterium]
MLKIEDLHLKVGGKKVLNGLDLTIEQGEKTVMFGPNGAGKSSLLYAIMGFPGYEVLQGKVIFKGKDITKLPVDQRAKLGLGVAFQSPPAIRGIKLKEMLAICRTSASDAEIKKLAEKLNMADFLERDVNLGFSGGEAKRAELLQILVQRPSFVMFDEPDSGVDVENVELVGKEIDRYLSGHAGIVITHQGYILNFIKASRACVLLGGRIICSGDPREIMEDIKSKGYEGCVKCQARKGMRDEG